MVGKALQLPEGTQPSTKLVLTLQASPLTFSNGVISKWAPIATSTNHISMAGFSLDAATKDSFSDVTVLQAVTWHRAILVSAVHQQSFATSEA